jgi:hypothetical protein
MLVEFPGLVWFTFFWGLLEGWWESQKFSAKFQEKSMKFTKIGALFSSKNFQNKHGAFSISEPPKYSKKSNITIIIN